MKLHHKAAAAAVSAGLVFGSVSLVSAESASAATSCAAQDQAAGAASAREAGTAARAKRTAKHLKQAKKANRKHHSAATKKRLKKAKRLNKHVHVVLRQRQAAKANAIAAANKCHAATGTVTPANAASQLGDALATAGLSTAQIQPLIDALAKALNGFEGLTPSQLTSVAQQLEALAQGGLSQGSLTPAALTDAITKLTSQLEAAGVPADQIAAPLKGFLDALGGSGLSASALQGIVDQVTKSLGTTNLTDGQLSQVVATLLEKLSLSTQPTDPTLLTSVVDSTLNTVLGDLKLDSVVPATAIDSLTTGLQGTLTSVAGTGSGLAGLAPVTGGVLGLI
jgi:hypothetical protein